MVKRFVIVMLAVLTMGLQAFAQNAVTGKVVDSKGEPIAAAGVQVKGTNTGVITDLDGNFRINAGAGVRTSPVPSRPSSLKPSPYRTPPRCPVCWKVPPRVSA